MKVRILKYKYYIVFILAIVLLSVVFVDSLKAKYAETLVVTENIDLEIGEYKLTLVDGEETQKTVYSKGDILPKPTKDGYIFNGWFNDNNEKVNEINSDLALNAHWGYTWTVNYDGNGGEGEMESTIHGKNSGILLRENAFTNKNYEFGGWYLSKEKEDGTYLAYVDQSNGVAWDKVGKQVNGYKKYIFSDGDVLEDCGIDERETITAHAIWLLNNIDYFYKDGKFYSDETYSTECEGIKSIQGIVESVSKDISIQLDSTYTVSSNEEWNSINGYRVVIKRNTDDRMLMIGDGNNSVNLTISGDIVLDCNNEIRSDSTAIITNGGSTFTIGDNVIIQNGLCSSGAGAIYIKGGTFIMNGGVIRNNTAGGNGGAMIVRNGGTFIMRDGIIENNYSAKEGGGISIEDAKYYLNGVIENNKSDTDYDDVYIMGTSTELSEEEVEK